ncbi:MAG: hypothetical protein KC621_24290 [Myxococcales bacterium]|nr:hypothetical protein [Myxococcales bacterium]
MLTDPELDLLREMLDEDPAADALIQVSEDLLRRSRWPEAVEVLTRGVAALQSDADRADERVRAFELLARGALETGQYDLALAAIEQIQVDPATQAENARVQILVLERSGRIDDASARVDAFLAVDPDDVIVTAARERLDAPPPSPRARAADPFYTVERAERYALIGRSDRAIRAYHRILLAGTDAAPSILMRLRQLQSGVLDEGDDLSEELTDPGLVPEQPLPGEVDVPPIFPDRVALTMPEPSLQRVQDEPDELSIEDQTTSESLDSDPDEEDTDVNVGRSYEGGDPSTKRDRRRRRSLIRK